MSRPTLIVTLSAAAGLSLAGASAAHAELLAYEGFDYAPGNDLAGQAGGSGFIGAWVNTIGGTGADANALQTSSTSLSYGSLPTSDGSVSNAVGDRADVYYRLLDLPDGVLDAGESIWLSILFQRTASTKNWSVSLGDEGNSGAGVGGDNDASDDLDVQAFLQGTGDKTDTSDATAYNVNDVLFLVARITNAPGPSSSNTGHKNVDLWVNPGLDEDLDAQPLGSGDSTYTRGYGGLADVDRLRLYSHQDNGLIFDEIRIGTEFADVVPEPASLALLGLGGAAVFGRRRPNTAGRAPLRG